jgi:hypothetical protein
MDVGRKGVGLENFFGKKAVFGFLGLKRLLM